MNSRKTLLSIAAALTLASAVPAAAARDASGTPAQRAQAALGIALFLLLTYLIGRLRRPRTPVNFSTLVWGLALQFAFAAMVLGTGPGRIFFQGVNDAVVALLSYAEVGARFLFGNLVQNNVPVGQPVGDPLSSPIASPSAYASTGPYFAFSVLPTIIFFASLSALLYHTGIMQWVVYGIARLMQRTMKTSGAETLSSAANIFLGQNEAPLLVRPYIPRATNSELMAIMVGGFANIASGVLAAYVGMLRAFEPDIAGHLIAASIISAPCSLVVAKLLLPEAGVPETAGKMAFQIECTEVNAVDAAGRGALEGGVLALNVGAMLIAFIALVAMANAIIGYAGSLAGVQHLSLELLLGYAMAPFAWLLGIPWSECTQVGQLLGVKTVLNEFYAYLSLAGQLAKDPSILSPRSLIICCYALCGFANFASVAMQIGSIGALAPERRHDLARLGLYAMLGGTLSSMVTACVVGILL